MGRGLAEALRRGDAAQDFGMGRGAGLPGRGDLLGHDAAVVGQDAAQEGAVLAARQGRAPDGFRGDAGVEVGDELGEGLLGYFHGTGSARANFEEFMRLT